VNKTAVAMNIVSRRPWMITCRRRSVRSCSADTPDFALDGAGFIFRRRIAYREGIGVGDPEFVLKFRHPEFEQAGVLDMRLKTQGKYRIKFKAGLLPPKDHAGGRRILYSHNCQFGRARAAAPRSVGQRAGRLGRKRTTPARWRARGYARLGQPLTPTTANHRVRQLVLSSHPDYLSKRSSQDLLFFLDHRLKTRPPQFSGDFSSKRRNDALLP
jgi:hypothetical protein